MTAPAAISTLYPVKMPRSFVGLMVRVLPEMLRLVLVAL